MAKKKIIRITESDIARMVKRGVKRAIRESVETEVDAKWADFINLIIPQLRKKFKSFGMSDWNGEWGDDGYVVDREYEIYKDDLDLGKYSNIFKDVAVFCQAEGGAWETYSSPGDYYNPPESSGTGEVTVRITRIEVSIGDEWIEDAIDTDIVVDTYGIDW